MVRIALAELRHYLLGTKTSFNGCLRRPALRTAIQQSHPPCLANSPLGLRDSKACVRSHHSVATGATTAQPTPPQIPYRKQQKDQAKLLKASGQHKKSKPNAQNQVVQGWELTVGIEIHAQLNTTSKLFSPASAVPSTAATAEANPNSKVLPFDLAIPGSQPLFQHETLIPAVRAALALNCEIQPVSRWDRKHYFHWDQPSGYQLTQYYEPFARDGYVMLHPRDRIYTRDGSGTGEDSIRIGIQQIQMEQDTAKTLAQPDNVHWLDFNRAGAPLIEIITRPEIHHPATAAAFVRKVQIYLNAVDACTSGMESGGLRADVNVSVRPSDGDGVPTGPLGRRTEIKNLSSVKAVEDAIIAERDRQIEVLKHGGVIEGETRGWSLGSTETRRLRGKEGEVDYRYMPDPDLGPVLIGNDLVAHLQGTMGVLPDDEVDTLVGHYGLTNKDALALLSLDDGGRVEYFHNVLEQLETTLQATTEDSGASKIRAQLVSNWVLHELGRLTSDKNISADGIAISNLGITPAGECVLLPAKTLAEILEYLHTKRITARAAKEVLFAVFRGDLRHVQDELEKSVRQLIEERKLWRKELSGEEYKSLAYNVLEHEESVMQYFVRGKSMPQGKLMFLVGRMMRMGADESVDPKQAEKFMRTVIEERLGSLDD